MRYSNPVVKLVRDGSGRVTGAICKDSEGYYQVNAKKGVILATGGFDANPAMLKAWCRPEDIANAASWCPNYGTTGDGQLMGLAVGGQMDPLPAAVMNFDFGSPDSFYSSNLGITSLVSGGLMINEKGIRFASEALPFEARSNAITAQCHYGENCWRVASSAQVVNESVLEALKAFEEKEWGVPGSHPRGACREDWSVPAEHADGPGTALQRLRGHRHRRGLQPPHGGAKKIEGDVYYAIKHQSSILSTVSGLVVDYNCNVLDYDDQPIPGLYAAGNASADSSATTTRAISSDRPSGAASPSVTCPARALQRRHSQ